MKSESFSRNMRMPCCYAKRSCRSLTKLSHANALNCYVSNISTAIRFFRYHSECTSPTIGHGIFMAFACKASRFRKHDTSQHIFPAKIDIGKSRHTGLIHAKTPFTGRDRFGGAVSFLFSYAVTLGLAILRLVIAERFSLHLMWLKQRNSFAVG